MLFNSWYTEAIGGAERQVASLAPEFKKLDVDVSVLNRAPRGYVLREEKLGTPVYRTPYNPFTPLRALFFIVFGLRHIRQLQPDILHVHGLYVSTIIIAILAKRSIKVPVIAKILRGGSLGDIGRLKAKPLGTQILALVRKHIDNFVVISEEIREELVNEGLSADKCHYIPNGVDIDRYKPLNAAEKKQKRQDFGIPDAPTVIFAGRLEAEKRVGQLLESWKTIAKEFPEARLVIVGDGSRRQFLESQSVPRVSFLGMINNVSEWLQVSDVYVLPSVAEGLSNSLLEAMASGLPTIVTAVGDAPDLIRTGENGWCIQPDDVPALTEALTEALGSLEQIRVYGERNRERVLRDYQLQVTAKKLRALYEELVG